MITEQPAIDDTISIIIPVYNAERTLEQCLESVRGQGDQALDIICLNDGSTDGSLSILRRHEREDPRVRVVDKENEGYGATCNRGIDLARGSWIAIVEPDDWVDASAYEMLLAAAQRTGQAIDIIKAPWFEVSEGADGNEEERPCALMGRLNPPQRPFSVGAHPILLRVHPAIWSALYRASYLRERCIRFRELPGAGWADNPFLIESMCQTSSILYVNVPFYHYRVDNPSSSSNDARPEAVAIPFERWTEMLEILERLGIDDEGILSAHYARGFNYADDAKRRFGAENESVKQRIEQMFGLMVAGVVRRIPYLSPARRRGFFVTRGERVPHIPLLGWWAHGAREIAQALRSTGLKSLLRRLARR